MSTSGRLTRRGYAGPERGRVSYVEAPVEYRGTTVQTCGLWPFAAGSGTPMVGTPIGSHLLTGATVCFDPITWFTRARLLHNPSAFFLGLPGLGKSSLCRRTVLGLAGQGVTPLVLGDLKPDYTDVVRALGGQVVRLGRGLGSLNPLDVGALGQTLPHLSGTDAERVRAEVHGRRVNLTAALVTVMRRKPVPDDEETILSAALRVLDSAHTPGDPPPLLSDLVRVLEQGPDEIRAVTLDRGNEQRYRDAVDPLQRSLLGLLDGPFGRIFGQHTSTPLDLAAPAAAIDTSGIDLSDERLQAAVLVSCWSQGFGAIEASQTLADAGLAPQRHYYAVLDELWRVLRAGAGMVERLDGLTRINRQVGVGQAYITHTLSDLEALADEQDRAKARGFVERAGAVVCGGLPRRELDALGRVVQFSRAEANMITKWSTPASWDTGAGREAAPPGQGNFLVKVGQRPGIPVHLDFVPIEQSERLHNTNLRWSL